MPSKTKFERLGLFYILALAGIAATVVISQLLVQSFITKQTNDSRLVNIAGRQRMLSQKISKVALQIKDAQEEGTLESYKNELKQALGLWVISHHALLAGSDSLGLPGRNPEEIKQRFRTLEPHYNSIRKASLKLTQARLVDSLQVMQQTDSILLHEDNFLSGMNDIVFQYDIEAKDKVQSLSRLELILFFVALFIILLELVFIFRPIAQNVRKTVSELVESEDNAKKMTAQISKLYEELGKSYQDLEGIGIEKTQPSTFLKMNANGDITYMSNHFRRLLEYERDNLPPSFTYLLKKEGYSEEFLDGVIKILEQGKNWYGEVKLTSLSGDFIWLEMSIVPLAGTNNDQQHLLAIASDVTEIKEAKMRSREINKEKIQKRVKEQEYRSVLILEGQEEERKRLSRELHDGVGQMLTALKLNLESITPSSSVHTRKRLDETRSLMKSVIKEVRRVSFNLTPSSLSDFGLLAGIKKFCMEVSGLADVEVVFENRSRFINRLDKNVEVNLYRVIQEAVNNAIKYAKAEKITVSFEHTFNELSIIVADNGRGFDYGRLLETGHFEATGHGIFNMRERIAFIEGKFDIETALGKGTKILLTIPLN